jgi:hypothetical protein
MRHRRPVAEHGAEAGGEHGRESDAVGGQDSVPHCIHPAVHSSKASAGNAMLDRLAAHTRFGQLPSRHHPMLSLSEHRDRPIGRVTARSYVSSTPKCR